MTASRAAGVGASRIGSPAYDVDMTVDIVSSQRGDVVSQE